jgi:hypothetical protein
LREKIFKRFGNENHLLLAFQISGFEMLLKAKQNGKIEQNKE